MKRMIRLPALLLALLMLLSCVGCGAEVVEEKGMEIRAAFVEVPTTLDPVYATTEEERTIVVHLFENLMKHTAAGVVPAQAASYEHVVNEDGTETYTFTLRGDTRWSDGVLVTADDFVHAWQRLVAPQIDSPHRAILKMVAGYEEAIAGDVTALQVAAPDRMTFTVTLQQPCAYFLSVVCTDTATMPVRADAVPAWMIVEEEDSDSEEAVLAERVYPDWTMKKATLITNGAYAVRNFNAGHLTVVETEGYYDSLRLGPKKIDFFFAESLERAIGSYEKGEADFVLKCGEQEGSVVAHRPEMLVLAVNQMSSLSEPVRQALSLSLDRNSLAALSALDLAGAEGLVPEGISTLSGNLFRQVNGPVTPCDDVSVAKNREKAKIAVDALNRGGFDINDRLGVVTLLYESGAVNSRVALQVQKQWQEQLGITVTPIAVASDEMLEALQSGAFTIAMMSVSDESNTASGYLAHYASDSYENYGQHHSNAYDILLRAAAVSDSAEARDAYLADAERLLLESGYVIPLCSRTYRYLLRENMTGMLCRDMGVYQFSGLAEIVV